ncbi:MAG TPA: neutral/alkaline non-lysosomal ceramidase N-terminal domain-containing protein, partial [Cytophagaceae bacterium]|nr:neutral/alkaline non-lysosomal ceramidase N-terminal domain-containing protein [Cytophagaceae bacterium]
MKKALNWTIRIFVGLLVFCLILIPFLFEKIDRTPYREMGYYKEMRAQLDTFQLDTIVENGAYFKAGWSRKNITPAYLPVMGGYGFRDKTTSIHDSVFVRAFVFDNGKNKAAFISVDLLIFPPVIEAQLRSLAKNMGYKAENLYLSATHTHHAPGGWAEGVAGKVLAGNYNEQYVKQVVDAIISAIKEAEGTMEEAETGLGLFDGTNFVKNRLNMPDSEVDPWVRVLRIRKKSGKEAALIVYSAHSNCLKMTYTCLSGDYPARMISQLEKAQKIEFAMYAAGMVGSHIPKQTKKDIENEPFVNDYGDSLAKLINKGLDSIELKPGNELCSAILDL